MGQWGRLCWGRWSGEGRGSEAISRARIGLTNLSLRCINLHASVGILTFVGNTSTMLVVGNKSATSLLFYSGIFENVTSLRDSGFSPPDSALRGESSPRRTHGNIGDISVQSALLCSLQSVSSENYKQKINNLKVFQLQVCGYYLVFSW